MKTIFFLLAFAASVFAQNVAPVQYYTGSDGTLIFYNEAGTQVYNMAVGDSIATQTFPLDGNDISFSISIGYGDTLHANVYYQFVNGTGGTAYTGSGTVSGVRKPGAEALSTLQDSLNTTGLGTGALTGARAFVSQANYSGYVDVVSAGSSMPVGTAVHDSTHTVTFTVSPTKGHAGVQFVLVGLGGTAELGGNHTTAATSLFKNARVTVERVPKR